MSGGSIIDQIQNGVVPASTNEALQALSRVFGPGLIENSGAVSMLVMLSTALSPLYFGLLLLILMYMGVSGVARSAMDGKFLGNRWSSVGVPAMFIMCVVLLSPVPTKSGITLGQYVFVKGLIFGSNAADYTLKQAFVLAANQANGASNNPQNQAAINVAKTMADEPRVMQINERMKQALPSFVCAEYLTMNGYNTSFKYFAMLDSICGMKPEVLKNYTARYLSSDGGYLSQKNQIASQLRALGVDAPNQITYDKSSIEQRANANVDVVSKELNCYYDAFTEYLKKPIPDAAARAKVGSTPAIPSGFTTQTAIRALPLEVNIDPMEIAWGVALTQAYGCVMTSGAVTVPAATAPPSTSDPWARGWSYAPRAIMDISDFVQENKTDDLGLASRPLPTIDTRNLSSSVADQKSRENMDTTMEMLNKIFASGRLDNVAQGMVKQINTSGNNATSGGSGNGGGAAASAIQTGNTWAQAIQAATAGGLALTSSRLTPAAVSTAPEIVQKFLGSFAGKTTTLGGASLGVMTRYGAAAAKKLYLTFDTIRKASGMLDSAIDTAKGLPVVGKVAGGIADLAKKAMSPSPTLVMALSFVLFLFVVVQYVPQLILIAVLLLWVARAAVWFFIIPLATVIIALPETRAGHDIWKSALSIIMTPFLAVILYLISLFISDSLYSIIIAWTFEPYITAWQNNSGAFAIGAVALTIAKDLLLGELGFRVMAGIGFFIAIFMFLNYMVLRGTDMITGALGLRSNSGDLGNELSDVRPIMGRAGLRGV